MFDLESKFCFHLRLTGEKDKCLEVVKAFNQKWCTMAMLTAYEEVGDNHHTHSHIQFDKTQYDYHMSGAGKTARSAFFKKVGFAGLFNFQKLDKEPIHNLQYCIKDMNIIFKHNVKEEQLEEIKNKVIEIQNDMKKDSRLKCVEAFIEHMNGFKKLYEKDDMEYTLEEKTLIMDQKRLSYIAKFINSLYIDKWDKEPPIGRLKALVIYVGYKYSSTKGALVDYKQSITTYYDMLF